MTFNYRLGRLGHFAFPALSAEHPEEPKGSYAYMDQIAALKWVQDNIAAFGGDLKMSRFSVFRWRRIRSFIAYHTDIATGLFHKQSVSRRW